MATIAYSESNVAQTVAADLGKVINYKNPQVVSRIARENQISINEAQNVFESTKQFLYLCGANPDGVYSPTPKIDSGWHEFIMYTREYQEFCERYFGRIIHHVPNEPGAPKDIGRPLRTLRAAIEIFGVQNLSSNWIYTDRDGNPLTVDEVMSGCDVSEPCDSCGCAAACNDG